MKLSALLSLAIATGVIAQEPLREDRSLVRRAPVPIPLSFRVAARHTGPGGGRPGGGESPMTGNSTGGGGGAGGANATGTGAGEMRPTPTTVPVNAGPGLELGGGGLVASLLLGFGAVFVVLL